VERVLGTGGFGITYLSRDASLGRKVVIKENLPSAFAFRDTVNGTVRPRSDLAEDKDNFRWSMENFLREADTLASLDHPGIVSVLRKFEANGTAYFVMPNMEGLPLDELMRNRRERGEEISDDELRGLLEHVLDALSYLHSRGIYHRDIKPGNILVTKEGVPILIDFGSARQRLSERSMTVVESKGYTPFEQLESKGNVGPWSDLYSLGATVAKMVTGKTAPQANDRMRNDPYAPLAEDLDLRDRYSSALLKSIDRALEVDESSRWQDAREWQQALIAVEEPIPPAVPATTVAPSPEAPARTEPEPPKYEEWSNSPAGIANIRRKRTLEREMFEKWEEKYAKWSMIFSFVFPLIISIPLAGENIIVFILATGLIAGGTIVLLPLLIKKLYIGWKIKRM
jgi:serine/threonine protein kinase